MANYFLTGASGFIASNVAEMLLDAGHSVFGLDNNNDYYDPILKLYRLDKLKNMYGFSFTQGDIEDLDLLEKIFSENKFDAVLNLAARAGVRYSLENPHIYMSTNAHGMLNILEMMRKFEVKKLVLASTSSAYAGAQMPFVEDLPVNLPISPYAASKRAAELMAYTYHNLFDIDTSIVRYFTVYGPAGRPDMAYFRFIKWIDEGIPILIYGDGTQGRDFTFVSDIARGTVLALNKIGYEIINLGGSNPVSLNKMIEIIEDLLGKKAIRDEHPFQATDMPNTWAENSKAKRILGWSAEIKLEDGLAECVKWYKNNKDLTGKIKSGLKK
jgi:UDP-glucuronate 4-epimerase